MKYVNLGAFGALTLAAGAFGVHLGQSAISDINPLYFQGAAVHPRDRGAAVPEMLEAQPASFADAYGWAQGQAAREADCGDCDALAARDAYSGGGDAVFAVLETGWTSDPRPAAYFQDPRDEPAEEAVDAQRTAADDQWAQVDRYSHYPLQAEPESESTAVAAASEEQGDAPAAAAEHQQFAMVQE